MIRFPEAFGFALAVLAAVALVSFLIGVRARELGHPSQLIWQRLSFMWMACLVGLAIGIWVRAEYPGGLFDVSFTRIDPDVPVAQTASTDAGWPLVLALLGMGACLAVALWSVKALQHPPDFPEEDEER